jgi:hypothetical protein
MVLVRTIVVPVDARFSALSRGNIDGRWYGFHEAIRAFPPMLKIA